MKEILYRVSNIAFYGGLVVIGSVLTGLEIRDCTLYLLFAVLVDHFALQRLDSLLIITAMEESSKRGKGSNNNDFDNNDSDSGSNN